MSAYLTKGYWRYGFSLSVLLTALLAAFGALWLVTEILMFFDFKASISWLKDNQWAFFLFGVAWAIWENRPIHKVTCTLANRDIKIEIRVGDLFSGKNAVVIGCNTSFDTDISSGVISPKSVQGQFTKRFYSNVAHLDTDIAQRLVLPFVPTPVQNPNKQGKTSEYPIGTTLTLRPNQRTAYLCAIAHMNAQGNAHATFDDFKTALPALWEHIASAGDHGDISVPVLGSVFARIPQNRETLVREILQSFIAACAAQRPCNSLTVVIHPSDYYKFGMNLKELGDFLLHKCKYIDFVSAGAQGIGQPAPP